MAGLQPALTVDFGSRLKTSLAPLLYCTSVNIHYLSKSIGTPIGHAIVNFLQSHSLQASKLMWLRLALEQSVECFMG